MICGLLNLNRCSFGILTPELIMVRFNPLRSINAYLFEYFFLDDDSDSDVSSDADAISDPDDDSDADAVPDSDDESDSDALPDPEDESGPDALPDPDDEPGPDARLDPDALPAPDDVPGLVTLT